MIYSVLAAVLLLLFGILSKRRKNARTQRGKSFYRRLAFYDVMDCYFINLRIILRFFAVYGR